MRPQPDRGPWAAPILLMAAYSLSWTDRILPAIMVEPMKASLGASDTELAMLTGFAFALSHATLSLPLSWLADYGDRAVLIALGVLVWSLMTAACGVAPDFRTLFIFRMGVGLGEAVLLPAAYSLIADLFSREDRPKAIMLFVLGWPIGSALAFAGGGSLLGYFESGSPAVLGGIEAWRATFLIVGAAGVVIAMLMMLLPEPRRRQGQFSKAERTEEAMASTGEFLVYLRRASFFLVPLIIAVTMLNMFANGFMTWIAPLFERRFGWATPAVGAALGPTVLITGLVGAPLGAWLIATVGRWRRQDGAVTVLALVSGLMLPLAALSPLAASGVAALAGISFVLTMAAVGGVAAPAAVVNSAPPAMRARVFAVYLVIANLLGSGGGALVYALSTDYLFGDATKLHLSMATVSAALLALALLLLMVADGRYHRVMRLSGEAPQ